MKLTFQEVREAPKDIPQQDKEVAEALDKIVSTLSSSFLFCFGSFRGLIIFLFLCCRRRILEGKKHPSFRVFQVLKTNSQKLFEMEWEFQDREQSHDWPTKENVSL
jgi:hypothetical protein